MFITRPLEESYQKLTLLVTLEVVVTPGQALVEGADMGSGSLWLS